VSITVLPPGEAYSRWAPTYEEAGALAELDELARRRLDPSPETPLFDAACGTGRRLRRDEGGFLEGAFGIDLVFPMLLAGARGAAVAAADLRAIPFDSGAFRTAWCRLAVGHVAQLDRVYAELGRVLAPRGTLLVTDFHPDASGRGMMRSFRCGPERLAVEHHVHDLAEHRAAAASASLAVEEVLELPAGVEVRHHFEAAGKLDAWEAQRDIPVLLALRFRRG
jgi:malonyl-CoA O-methyltransferase